MKKFLLLASLVTVFSFCVYSPSLYPNGIKSGSFFSIDQQSVINASASNNATITPVGSYQVIDAYTNEYVASTINVITTLNSDIRSGVLPIGTIVMFQTFTATRDIYFLEGGNLLVSVNPRVLTDPADVIGFQLYQYQPVEWREIFYTDNN